MDKQALLQRLDSDGIEHLWIIYHDYNGRSCAKSVPKRRFASALERGVVFAQANVDFTLEDHQAEGSVFLADTATFWPYPTQTVTRPSPTGRQRPGFMPLCRPNLVRPGPAAPDAAARDSCGLPGARADCTGRL